MSKSIVTSLFHLPEGKVGFSLNQLPQNSVLERPIFTARHDDYYLPLVPLREIKKSDTFVDSRGLRVVNDKTEETQDRTGRVE